MKERQVSFCVGKFKIDITRKIKLLVAGLLHELLVVKVTLYTPSCVNIISREMSLRLSQFQPVVGLTAHEYKLVFNDLEAFNSTIPVLVKHTSKVSRIKVAPEFTSTTAVGKPITLNF